MAASSKDIQRRSALAAEPPGMGLWMTRIVLRPIVIVAAAWLAGPAQASGATVVVNSAADTLSGCATTGIGTCSLRDAITFANANAGADTIEFAIGTGPQVIRLLSPLPAMTDQTYIQGWTQPGSELVRIELDGSLAGPGADGLQLLAGNSGVASLSIYGFDGNAIRIAGGGNTIVTACFIGIDHTGAVIRGNGGAGVLISGSPNNWIGFPEQLGNVIAANQEGIRIEGAGSDGNILLHNSIGATYDLYPVIGNSGVGIEILSGVGNIIVEGEIVGSGSHGIVLGPGSSGAFIQVVAIGGPYIFTGGNNGDGILVSGSSSNFIGGFEYLFSANIIVQNAGAGIRLTNGATGNLIAGNMIGTDQLRTGSGSGNRGSGIAIENSSGNFIGGEAPGGNAIAFNGGPGISVVGTAIRNAISRNAIFSNGGPGIDLGGDGVTPNHVGTGSGPNLWQNYPVLTRAGSIRGEVILEGTLEGAPGQAVVIEFFASAACHSSPPNDFGEGRTFLGSIKATPGITGTAGFQVTLGLPAAGFDGPIFPGDPAGRVFTATATDEDGNSSEFLSCFSNVIGVEVPFRPPPRQVRTR